MDSTQQVNALLRQLDAQRDAYLESFRQVHELLAQKLAATASPPPQSGTVRPRMTTSEPHLPGSAVSRAPSDRESYHIRKTSAGLNTLTTSSDSRRTGENSDDDATDEDLYVSTVLQPRKYDDETLRLHLQAYKWNPYGARILAGVIDDPSRILQDPIISKRQGPVEDRSHLSDYQVFDVGSDGAPVPVDCTSIERQSSRAQAIWHAIKEVNQPPKQRLSVGRITILRELSPMLFGAVHHAMSEHLDVEELFRHLVESEGTSANLHRAFEEDVRKQRSFVFNFEYFTIIGKECQPMKWQLADRQQDPKPGHIRVTRCSSVVALVLHGPAIKKVKNLARRATTSNGYVYDPWAAWEVLNLQCYPDWNASTDVHDSAKHYVNGVEAFMVTLLGEYRDAQKRFEHIYKDITTLITPPLEFMFDSDIRDQLLFEDKDFTYSRRYFWAYQTLGLLNDSIKAMIDAYHDTFTDEVWEGRHKTLWPLLEQQSPRNVYFKKRMSSLKASFEAEMNNLRELIRENNERRGQIAGLKEELYKGTTIQESRKSVENTEVTIQQGHNVKLLTLVNIFFLPLTFTTGIFGMQTIPTAQHYWVFGIVTATVCVPFFVLIGSLNTTRGMHWWRTRTGLVLNSFGSFLAWALSCGKVSDDDPDDIDGKLGETGVGRAGITRHSTSMQNARDLRMRRYPTTQSNASVVTQRLGTSIANRDTDAREANGFPQGLARSDESQLAHMWSHLRAQQRGITWEAEPVR